LTSLQPLRLPASYAQELLWLLHRAAPENVAYNVSRAYRVPGALDAAALLRALDALVARHEILRTTYGSEGDAVVQIIHSPAQITARIEDCSHLAERAREAAVRQLLRAAALAPFDLAAEAPFRVLLVRSSANEHVLQLTSHHIASDGWSGEVLLRDLDALYARELGDGFPLAPLPIQYADFAAWQRETIAGERLAELLAYWRDELAGAELSLQLPTDFPRPVLPSGAAVTRELVLDRATAVAVRGLAARCEATLYVTLLAAFGTLLHRITGSPDVLIGSPILGRDRPELEPLIGFFANTVVQRARFAGDPTFAELVARLRRATLDAYDHQDVPFEKLVLELRGATNAAAPLLGAVFTMLTGGGPDAARLGPLTLEPLPVAATTKFDLTLFAADRGDEVALTLCARTDLYAPATVSRMLGQLRTLLLAAAADPQRRVGDLPLLAPDETAQLARWNATATGGTLEPVTAAIERAALRAPQRVAVRCGVEAVTYGTLWERSGELARRLRRAGVGPGIMVGIARERSIAFIVALVAVLRAGGAYVPLVPDLPEERRRRQAQLARVALVLDEWTVLPEAMPDDPLPAIALDDLAYVLFTSGSTGEPKGVAIAHGNLANYVAGIARALDAPADARAGWSYGLVSTAAADLGNTTLFAALTAGGELHVIPPDVATDPARFAAAVHVQPLDVLKITPSHLRALLDGAPTGSELLPRRRLILGGEAVPWRLAEQVLATHACRLFNHYGPTETTVGACTFEVTAASAARVRAAGAATVPIGLPLANVQLHVLDARAVPLPVGIPGELWIGGAGVAPGYLHDPVRTAERFVDVAPFGRLYRTGDRVRRLPSGEIEFLGRIDRQVKVRGYRVELGEIEAALAAQPAVREAAVLLREDGGEPELCAYLAADTAGDAEQLIAELRAALAARLPAYMVPSRFAVLDALPLTPNGKLDRAALPGFAPAGGAAGGAAPASPAERGLAEIWCEVLRIPQVGRDDDFLSLGGHSLAAIRVLGRISRAFGVRLPLRALFDAPSLAELAARIEREAAAGGAES
jgi:amino acid adenylation domain-containing protein